MRALQCTALEGPDALEVREVDAPSPGDEGVLVDVVAAGVSFPDLLMTRGQYQVRPEPPFTPGVECAGIVVEAPQQSGFQPGDRVMAATYMGGLAEQVVASPRNTFALPEQLTFEQGAGFVMNHHTAHFCLDRRGRLREGETVMVNGAAGGVGTATIQVAKAMGATVIGVASTEEKRQLVLDTGADHAVGTDGFKEAVKELTDGRGVDVVLDVVGGEQFLDATRCLAPEGRLLVVGFASGTIPQIAVNRLLLRNISVVGAAWGAFVEHDPSIQPVIAAELDRMVVEGTLDPVVGPVFDLDHGGDAVRCLEDREALGKVVVRVRDADDG